MGVCPEPFGLREHKKAQTRRALLRCGLDLFKERGYAATTVSDIARRAEVSQRTFFRYFASKEELVLLPVREAGALFLAELERRPPREEPLRALREAGRDVVTAMSARHPDVYLPALRLICSEPEVLAAFLRYAVTEQHRLASVLAAREGTEPGDPRPTLLAGAFNAAALSAAFAWEERQDGSPQTLQDTADDLMDLMPSAVLGRWRTGGRASASGRGAE
ncbi:TetR/AcrR family transcriptional regulator [Streptomyces sp. 7-21]|jgi:AcrR family transcriptional regulator|uniref:TetR/AcrR family transcriptional regulator n=1 Tax=Streptomyces sp. 7-21 TaxID=2802283 RepID=UPI0019200BAC|nr:TetR family transcriptional regulator [Streptomyces sp. 7-21]MBL1069030.1 TetR family transcriptional regulator [Streptomyces sp. 7-21]